MVVVLAGEWCGYRCRQQQDMEMICAFDWSSTDIHLAVGMENRRSSTSSGGGPRASKTCFSLRVGALTVSNES
jgi:hypothetical protein